MLSLSSQLDLEKGPGKHSHSGRFPAANLSLPLMTHVCSSILGVGVGIASSNPVVCVFLSLLEKNLKRRKTNYLFIKSRKHE